MLPKLQRPKISNCGTITEKLSGFIKAILKPLVVQRISFLQDTTDVFNKIISHLPEKAMLATMDFAMVYFNKSHQDDTAACLKYL